MKKRKTSEKIPLMDMCQTPGYGVEPLARLVSLSGLSVWEPAAGEGYLAKALLGHDCGVVTSDIEANFLSQWTLNIPINAIITNPPFSLKDQFTEQALAFMDAGMVQYVALLMQTEVISTKWFWQLVIDYGEPGVIWFNPRINFKMPLKGWAGAGSHFSTAWFTWGWFTGNRFINMEHWNRNYRRKFEV